MTEEKDQGGGQNKTSVPRVTLQVPGDEVDSSDEEG